MVNHNIIIGIYITIDLYFLLYITYIAIVITIQNVKPILYNIEFNGKSLLSNKESYFSNSFNSTIGVDFKSRFFSSCLSG